MLKLKILELSQLDSTSKYVRYWEGMGAVAADE